MIFTVRLKLPVTSLIQPITPSLKTGATAISICRIARKPAGLAASFMIIWIVAAGRRILPSPGQSAPPFAIVMPRWLGGA